MCPPVERAITQDCPYKFQTPNPKLESDPNRWNVNNEGFSLSLYSSWRSDRVPRSRPRLLSRARSRPPAGEDWQKISTTIRDVSVYAVPAFHYKSHGMQRGKNAVFVFRVDDICIAHLGDLGHLLTPAQLKMMGKIDILLVPIAGGYFTVTATEAKEVTRQVNPKIAIPMHFWWEQAVQEFAQGMAKVKTLNTPVLRISKAELPTPTEVVILPWGQRNK